MDGGVDIPRPPVTSNRAAHAPAAPKIVAASAVWQEHFAAQADRLDLRNIRSRCNSSQSEASRRTRTR
jgi:hypothetical protein